MNFFSDNPYERGNLNPLCDGEQQVVDYLTAHGYTVASVAEDRVYQLQDIDILAYKDSIENEIKIEVKNDSIIHFSGNMFLETCCNVELNKNGWFNYCGADFLFYRDKVAELTYIINLNDLRTYVAAHSDTLSSSCAKDYKRNGEVVKVSTGYLVSISDYMREYPETEIIHI